MSTHESVTWSKAHLQGLLTTGIPLEYLLFWGHTPKREGVVDASCFSQWFPRPFLIEGKRYETAEHFMMASKALLFHDHAAFEPILAADSPARAKALGRSVRGFDDTRWRDVRTGVVARGNLAKFGQHHDLLAHLRSTGDKVLVEASPDDRIWGIGMSASHPDARTPARWRGENLPGFALMEVRHRLASSAVR